ncbi:WLM domain containing protein [Rhodotorula toruloides]|uniref:WLM domain containing protein n=1 Tax=Rhodotorula toruloides TaxID=5286 RepID=A0A511KQK4_RHOTO|nr:WLM domain containing protein [Rhodotorula toruloides]
MPVGHKRFNEKRANPVHLPLQSGGPTAVQLTKDGMRLAQNDNITFIRVMEGLSDSNMALTILEALAAQFKPIMKEWGFGVNSLIEHEWNPTFAGRNWNAGEIIEIVLRRRDGSFAPYQFLLYVMCHELAHIREMNHSWSFQKVNKQIRAAVSQLRAQKYYGDGFWSSGRSLIYPDADTPFAADDEPTFACGGANKRSPRRRRRAVQAAPSRARGSAVKLGTTGRQTAIPAKPGGRVKRKGAFEGEGQVLSEDPEMSSFRRRARAKGAIEARAAAAEARLAAEKRAKAAEARARGAPMLESYDEKKGKVKEEVEDEWEDAGGFEAEGEEEWETELDANEVKLEEDEKRFLKEDMRSWRETFGDDDDEDVQPDLNTDGSSSSKGKVKASTSSSSAGTKRKASSRAPRSTPESSTSKARVNDVDLPDDLTPEERAWIEADINGLRDVEEGAGKKVRVAHMPMPEWMSGEKKGKGERAASTISISDSSDDDGSSTAATSRASSRSKGMARAVRPPSDDEEVTPAAWSSKCKNRESREELEPPTRKNPNPPFATSSARRSPLKFVSDTSSSKKHVRPLSHSPPRPCSSKSKTKTVRPPSDDDDEPKVPKKKQRKTRSDKGVKRGPRRKSGSVDGEEEGEDDGEKEVKKGRSPRKMPEGYAAKAKVAMKAKEKEKHRKLLEEIEEEEAEEERETAGKVKPAPAIKAKGKGKAKVIAPPEDDGDDDEIDWTADERNAAKPQKDVKGKAESADLVVVGLGLHAEPASRDKPAFASPPPPKKLSKLASRPVDAADTSPASWPPHLSTDWKGDDVSLNTGSTTTRLRGPGRVATDHYFDLSSNKREAFLDLLDKEDTVNRQGEVEKVAGFAARGNGKAKARRWRGEG